MSEMIDRKRLLDDVVSVSTGGMSSEAAARARTLLDELVTDWYREAGTDDDAPAVLDLLRREHEAALAEKSAGERLDAVVAAVLDRRIRRLGVQTFELGKQVVDAGGVTDAAKARGEALMGQVEALAAEVRAVANASVRAQLGRDLQEASLEALYAIEGKAMSMRLSHYARDAGSPAVS